MPQELKIHIFELTHICYLLMYMEEIENLALM